MGNALEDKSLTRVIQSEGPFLGLIRICFRVAFSLNQRGFPSEKYI
jgi:hypothetical protein